MKSSDTSTGLVLGYGMDDRTIMVRLPVGAKDFYCLIHCVMTGSEAQSASYSMHTEESLPVGKLAEA